MAGEHNDRHVDIGVGAGLADHLREFESVEDRHGPIGDNDIGNVVGKRFQPGRAVVGFINFACTETVQQRAQNPAHMGVVVDDEETQAVEIDADHGAPSLGPQDPMPSGKLPRRR